MVNKKAVRDMFFYALEMAHENWDAAFENLYASRVRLMNSDRNTKEACKVALKMAEEQEYKTRREVKIAWRLYRDSQTWSPEAVQP